MRCCAPRAHALGRFAFDRAVHAEAPPATLDLLIRFPLWRQKAEGFFCKTGALSSAPAPRRARALCGGRRSGAQIFAVGTGLTVPLALNAAYGAAVPALLLGGAIGLAAPKRLSKAPGRAFCVVLAVSLLVCSALLLAAGATLAQQTLLPNGRLLTSLMLTLSFALLCALSSGTGVCRVAFALRWLLPAALAVFAGLSLSSCSMAGLFPLLGAGVRSLGLSALLSLSACSPALMLFLPPQELETPAPVPKGGFFALRVGLAACSAR